MPIDLNLPLILIISLPESTLRRDYLCAQLDTIGLPYKIIEAIDGRSFNVAIHPNYDRDKRLKYFGRDLLGAELGCLLSHRKAMQHVVDHKLPYAIILEDDTVVENGDELCKIMQNLGDSKVKNFSMPHLVRLIGKKKILRAPYRVIKDLTPTTVLARTQGIPGSANAYFISNEGAKLLLPFLEKAYLPVDIIMGHGWMTGIDNLIAIPSPVHDRHWNQSYIGNQRFIKIPDKKTSEILVLNRTFCRVAFKLTEAIMKRLSFWWRNNFK